MMSGKDKFRVIKKLYFLAALLAAFILFPALGFAQGSPDLPCSGDDPYGNCPLDTSVWILAIIAMTAGAVFILKQQKTSSHQS